MTLITNPEDAECRSHMSDSNLPENLALESMEALPQFPTGKLVIKYLQKQTTGATLPQILHHLRTRHHRDSSDLPDAVESILENGTAMGFLEKKGSYFVNWLAPRECGCRRRRRSCRRRRRSRRRRRCIRRRCRCRRPGRRRRS